MFVKCVSPEAKKWIEGEGSGLVKEKEERNVCLKLVRALEQDSEERKNVFELLKEREGSNVRL